MSRFEDPVIISNSISGAIANRDQCPAIPYTPEEYAAEARRAVDEGASQIHIHARTPDGTPSLRDRGLPGDHRGDPGRGRRRDHQLLDRRDRRADREAARVPARAAARRRRSEHELDELREVLPAPQGLRLQGRLREQLRHDHDVPDRDERARDPARARVLRRRPRRQPRSVPRHGAARAAAADLAGDGRQRRDPAERPQRRLHVGADPGRRRGAQQLAGDRRLARPVEAARGLAQPRRQRPRRASRTTSTCRTARWRSRTAS